VAPSLSDDTRIAVEIRGLVVQGTLEAARERFAQRYGIGDAELARAIRAGLLRAIDDAERAGALSPFLGAPLRATVRQIPVDQAIELIQNARSLLGNLESFLGPAGGLIEQFLP